MDIAVIGMAGRFPEAGDVYAFYENLKNGRDSVRPYSRTRLLRTTVPVTDDYEIFAFLEDIDLFDHAFFNISRGEAENMDPHQRILLEVVQELLDDAGYGGGIKNAVTGVFLADVNLDYSRHATTYHPTLPTGNLNPVLAGRVARHFDFRGPAVMVDTACSSSLVALHMACNAIELGDTDVAVAGGINFKLFPTNRQQVADIGIHAPDGKAKTFSADANGTGSGEAAACVLLKPLQKALADGDIIHAVIKGSALNQDAALAGSLSAPSSTAQAAVICKAWKKAGIDPLTVTFIETHGTGTKLGDPIEVQGIDMAFRQFTAKKQHCAIASVKTNVGHTNSAAGITAFIKAVLSLKYSQLFPSLHFREPNPLIDFANSAAYVNDRLQPWLTEGVKRAGVSAFGISGTNCHAVLEEAPARTAAVQEPVTRTLLWTFSGKTAAALRRNIIAFTEALPALPAQSAADAAYTLYTGRGHHEYRCALLAADYEALLPQLDEVLQAAEPAPLKNPYQLVLLFSGDSIPDAYLMATLSARYPVFGNAVAACRHYQHRENIQSSFLLFSFQYAFYQLLKAAGINSSLLIGNGVGEVVTAVISGKITLEEGVKRSFAHETVYGLTPDAGNLQLLFKKLDGRQVLFAEIGGRGNITEALRTLAAPGHEIITLGQDNGNAWLSYARVLYLKGHMPAWEYLDTAPCHRITLPAYRFEQQPCWIRENEQADPAACLYARQWQPFEPLSASTFSAEGPFLLITDNGSWGKRMVRILDTQHIEYIIVSNGEWFRKTGEHSYQLRLNEEDDYRQLAMELMTGGRPLRGIIHMTACGVTAADAAGVADAALQPHISLLRGFHTLLQRNPCSYLVFTNGAVEVNNTMPPANPLLAAVFGLMATMPEEYPLLHLNCVDTDQATMDEYPAQIIRTLKEPAGKVFMAWRNGVAFTPAVVPVKVDEATPAAALKTGGIYLVAGDAGLQSIELCRMLQSIKGKIILLHRQPLPPQDEWKAAGLHPGHPAYKAVKNLKELTAQGADITCMHWTNSTGYTLQALLDIITEKYGRPDTAFVLPPVFPEMLLAHYAPGAFGLAFANAVHDMQLLLGALKGNAPQVVLFSGYSAVIGMAGQAATAAFHASLDALYDHDANFIHIRWPEWRQTLGGINAWPASAQTPASLQITAAEAMAILAFILQYPRPQVMVSATDPAAAAEHPYFTVGISATEQVITTAVPAAASSVPASGAFEREGWSATQLTLGAIWYEVLKTATLELDDDFFDLGGHSLSATRVLNQVEQQLQVKMEFDDMLDNGTLREMADYIDAHRTAPVPTAPVAATSIGPAPQMEYYPLSHAQARMWVLEQIEKDFTAYNMSAVYDLDGVLDPAAVAAAFGSLVSRHEILRTTFPVINGKPVQRVHSAAASQFAVQMENILSLAEKEKHIRQRLLKDTQTPFDLENGPLIRVTLMQVSLDRWTLFLTVHHMLADGASLQILLQEFQYFYQCSAQQVTPALEPLHLQYKDFAWWQQTQLDKGGMEAHRSYWMQQFAAGRPLLQIPGSHERPAYRTYTAARLPQYIDSRIMAFLKVLSGEADATLYMTMLAAVKFVLGYYGKTTAVIIGTPVSGREHAVLENQVGLYLNTIPVLSRFQPEMSFTAWLLQVRENVLQAFRHQAYPFDMLVNDLKLPHDPARNTLFDAGFTYNNFSMAAEADAAAAPEHNLKVSSRAQGFPTVKADLWFHIGEGEAGLSIQLDYNIALFDSPLMEKLLEDYSYILQTIATSPASTLNELSGLLDARHRQSAQQKQQEARNRNSELFNKIK
ncbi:KR domain-containing protein [Chitinophaga rupis]|uniref:KR domain-containing protein n=1 Tax=Chitinophaga rupis TaxID=573321 RepID=A0A1H8KD57_9BACT|nr:condensation domain-containing protein [Chitinophaga rupis]SEN90949.1 KR domain-containing protein [Chitinophaga rupis]